jgi:hypothetical protein
MEDADYDENDSQNDSSTYNEELYDADPNCKHIIVCNGFSGVKCRKCGGWFCY